MINAKYEMQNMKCKLQFFQSNDLVLLEMVRYRL